MYIIPYEADFECPKGHRYTAPVHALSKDKTTTCPDCYSAWISANVPNGTQVTKPVRVKEEINL